jgi:hypothetical protein
MISNQTTFGSISYDGKLSGRENDHGSHSHDMTSPLMVFIMFFFWSGPKINSKLISFMFKTCLGLELRIVLRFDKEMFKNQLDSLSQPDGIKQSSDQLQSVKVSRFIVANCWRSKKTIFRIWQWADFVVRAQQLSFGGNKTILVLYCIRDYN